ncbi:hypothetical protein K9M42_02745 [Patescibacteria group bacterium]|nr:hypothetical protein [Patescibacteria group bacterium]
MKTNYQINAYKKRFEGKFNKNANNYGLTYQGKDLMSVSRNGYFDHGGYYSKNPVNLNFAMFGGINTSLKVSK